MSNPLGDKQILQNALSAAYRELESLRAGRAQFMGYQLETTRDLICMYGYPRAPSFTDYYAIYKRIGPARAGCDIKVDDTWSDWPKVQDVTTFKPDGTPDYSGDQKTAFESALHDLFNDRKLALKDRIRSLDRKQRVGQYAASLIVAKDNSGAQMTAPLQNLSEGQLVKLVPLFESQVEEIQWDNDPTSPTYGEPTMYQINEFATGRKSQGQNRSFECHPSRLIVAAEGAEDGTNYGTPAMQSCFYALMDWEKIRMSAAEGMKKNADQRSVISLKDGSNLPSPGSAEAEIMDENINDFDKGKQSTLMMSDATMSALNSNMGDPTKSAELCEKEIAAGFKITMTKLFGYQTGKLASEKDQDKDNNETMDRRNGFGTELLLKHLDKFIDLGLLPAPTGEIVIDWPDAREPSESDKLSMASTAATIRLNVAKSGGIGEAVIPDSYFHEKLGITSEMLDEVEIDIPTEEDSEMDDVE